MAQKKRKISYSLAGLLILFLTTLTLLLVFLLMHPTVYFSKDSDFPKHATLSAANGKLRFVVPENIDAAKNSYIKIKPTWFTTNRLGKVTAVEAKPGKNLAIDFNSLEYNAEVFTIYTKNLFGFERKHDVIVDFSNFLRVFFPKDQNSLNNRKPVFLAYSKLQTEYKHIYEELYKIETFRAFNEQGIVDTKPVNRDTVFTKEKAKGHAFIVNNDKHISFIYDFRFPDIFQNKTQKTQVIEQVLNTKTKFTTLDPKAKEINILFKTPPFFISEFLGWYYIDPNGNRVDLKAGVEYDIPKFVKNQLNLFANFKNEIDNKKIGDELNKKGYVAVSYFDEQQLVFFDILKKGEPLKNHIFQKPGYFFEGWYKDPDLTKKVDFTKATADENISLYLKSVKQKQPTPPKPQNYTVNFITPANANRLLPLTVQSGSKLHSNYLIPSIVTAIDANGDLLELDYWNLVDPITGTKTKFDINTPITEDITLEAVMRKKVFSTTTYRIKRFYETLDQGQSFFEDTSKEEIIYDQKPNEEVELSKDKTAAPDGFTLSPDTIVKKIIKEGGSTVFELRYLRRRHSINFEVNYNGNYFKGKPTQEPEQIVKHEANAQKPANTPSIEEAGYEYTFKHWQLKDEMGNVYKEVSEFDFANTKITKNLTLVAYFERKAVSANYTIKHVLDGVDQIPQETITETKSALAGQKVAITERDRLPQFEQGFNVAPYFEEQTIKKDNSTVFTLRYSRKRFKVDFSYNSGVFAGQDKKVVDYLFGQTLKDTEHPTKTDPLNLKTYTFVGWRDIATGSVVDFGQNIKVDKDMHLKAIWTEETKTKPVYLKTIWEGLNGLPDEISETKIQKERIIGQFAQVTDADIQANIAEILAKHPHPNHENTLHVPYSVTSVEVTLTQAKQFLKVYFKAKTYTVNFDYTDLDPQSVAGELFNTLKFKYGEKIPAGLIQKMQAVLKRDNLIKDYVFEKLIDSETGQEINPNLAYNKTLKIRPIFKETEITVSVTPKVHADDLDKAEVSQWSALDFKAGQKFNFTPTQIKKGWKFLGWTTKPGNGVEEITVNRLTKVVYAVFAPGETTYLVKHIFQGIAGQIDERVVEKTHNTLTNSKVTIDKSNALPNTDHGFVVNTPEQTQIIQADGSTVFELRYARREFLVDFTVNYKNKFSGALVSTAPLTQKIPYEGKITVPQTPTISKPGHTYTFKHWQLQDGMNGQYVETAAFDLANTKITKNISLVAYFTEEIANVTYTINHIIEGADNLPNEIKAETKTAQANSQVTISSANRLPNEYQTGFDVATQSQTKEIAADGSTVFTLFYSRRRFNVNFEVNYNGNHFSGVLATHEQTQTVKYGSKVERPVANPALIKQGYGYRFVHWQLKDEMNGTYQKVTAFDFDTQKITKDTTLVAYFEEKVTEANYTINHVIKGLSGQPDEIIKDSSKTAKIGTQVTVNRENRLTKYDHGFEVAQQNQTKTIEANGSTVFELIYVRRKYRVNFVVNFNNYFAGAIASPEPEQIVEYGGKIKQPQTLPTLTKSGNTYTFKHWQLKAEMGNYYREVSPFDFVNTEVSANLTLVAYFEHKTITAKYTIKHIIKGLNGANDEIIEENHNTAQVGTNITIDHNNRLTKYDTGFTVDTQSQTKEIQADGQTTFTLVYTRRTYIVNFEVNPNNHFKNALASSVLNQSVEFEGKVTLPNPMPTLTKLGYTYTFKHWQVKDEMGNVYSEVSAFDFANTKITKNTTLVAYFEERPTSVTYTINHVLTGIPGQIQDTVETETKTTLIGSTVKVTENHGLAKFANHFYLESQSEEKTIEADGSTVFTLRYQRKTYTVTYNYNTGELNGNTQTTVNYLYQEKLRDVPRPSKTDPTGQKTYNFSAWVFAANNQIVDFSKNIEVESDLVLKAKWTEERITRPVYLKMIFEGLKSGQEETQEFEINKKRFVGQSALLSDADIQNQLSEFMHSNPHPNHQTTAYLANSVTQLTVENTQVKQYLTAYFKAKTYSVNFELQGLEPNSVPDALRQTTYLKYTETIPKELINQMKMVKKPESLTKDYEFAKIIDTQTGNEISTTTAYNKSVTFRAVFKEKPLNLSVTPRVSPSDLDKANVGEWPAQTVVAGEKFTWEPKPTDIKKGWKFVGWSLTPNGDAKEITTTRQTKEVYAVFKPSETTYTIKHIISGIQGEIDDRTETTVLNAKTNSEVTVSQSDRLTHLDTGFIANTPNQTKVIQADGSTVFELRYRRRTFNVNFTVNFKNQVQDASISTIPPTQTVLFEGKVKCPLNPAIAKAGRMYEFIHWQLETAMNGQYSEQAAYDFQQKVTQDLSLVAYFKETITVVKYTIKHILEPLTGQVAKEIIDDTNKAETGTEITVNQDAFLTQYSAGFYVLDQSETKTIQADGSTTFTLYYTRRKFKVNFIVNFKQHFTDVNVSNESPQTVAYEDKVKRPQTDPSLSKPGFVYRFIHWQLLDEMNGQYIKVDAFDFATQTISKPLTLVAYFEEESLFAKYTIKHILKALPGEQDEVIEEQHQGEIGSEVMVNRNNRLKHYDHGFEVAEQYQAKNIKKDGTTLYTLVYTRRVFKVNFEVNFNGGYFSGAAASVEAEQSVLFEAHATKPTKIPTLGKQGFIYEFKRWQLKDEMYGSYREVSTFDFATRKITKDTTLVAYFEEIKTFAKYTINHVFEGIDSAPAETISDTTKMAQIGRLITVDYRDRLSAHDNGFQVDTQTQTKEIQADGSTTFTLHYTRRKFNVDFRVNYGHFSNVSASTQDRQVVQFGAKVQMPGQTPTLTKVGFDYTFKHWQLESEMNGRYIEVFAFDFTNFTVSGDIVLVAYFTEEITQAKYTIKHILEGIEQIGEVVEKEEKRAQVGKKITVSHLDILKKYEHGFEILGNPEEKVITKDGKTEFTLKYTRKTFKVNFNFNTGILNGETQKTVNFKYQELLKDPGTPQKTDPTHQKSYTFMGWQNLDNLSQVINFPTNFKVVGDMNLRASWQETKSTRKIYLRFIFESLQEGVSDEEVETPLSNLKSVGDRVNTSAYDIQNDITAFFNKNPHPNHKTILLSKSITELIVTTSFEKQYLTLYYKAETYDVYFNYAGLDDSSFPAEFKRPITLKYSQLLPAEIIDKMKAALKPGTDIHDFVFSKLMVENNELDPTLAYNRHISITPVYTAKTILMEITPTVSSVDLEKAELAEWPKQKFYTGEVFKFSPKPTDIKKGWKFLGWSLTPAFGSNPGDIKVTRFVTRVYAVFKQTDTTYTINHILKGIPGEIEDKTIKETKHAESYKNISVHPDSNKLTASEYRYKFTVISPRTEKKIQPDGSTEFNLVYQRNYYKVNFVTNFKDRVKGYDEISEYDTQMVQYQGKIKQPGNPFILFHGRTYTFVHWQLSKLMNGQYTKQDAFDFTKDQIVEETYLVAYFEETIHKVNFEIVHFLEKKGESRELDNQFEEVVETIQNWPVEKGATYVKSTKLVGDDYELFDQGQQGLLETKLYPTQNNTRVYQYYSLKLSDVWVYYGSKNGFLDNWPTKRTRLIPIDEIALHYRHKSSSYNIQAWSYLNEPGNPIHDKFVATAETSLLVGFPLKRKYNVHYRIFTQHWYDDNYDETFVRNVDTISDGETHTPNWTNPDPRIFKMTVWKSSDKEDENTATYKIQLSRLNASIQINYLGKHVTTDWRNFRVYHGSTIRNHNIVFYIPNHWDILKITLDGNEITKEDLLNTVIVKNYVIEIHTGIYEDTFGEYPQSKVDVNPAELLNEEISERTLNFHSFGRDLEFKFNRVFVKDKLGNKYEKYNGKYFKFEPVRWIKIAGRTNSMIAKGILDFSPFNLLGPHNQSTENWYLTFYSAMLKDMEKIIGTTLYSPTKTYSLSSFGIDNVNDQRYDTEPTDYALEIYGNTKSGFVREYRGIDLMTIMPAGFDEQKWGITYTLDSKNSFWTNETERSQYNNIWYVYTKVKTRYEHIQFGNIAGIKPGRII